MSNNTVDKSRDELTIEQLDAISGGILSNADRYSAGNWWSQGFVSPSLELSGPTNAWTQPLRNYGYL